MPSNVRHAVHLVALDESSEQLKPLMLAQPRSLLNGSIRGSKIEEIWLPGSHLNVTGGYPYDRLARSALVLMLKKFRESLLNSGWEARMDPEWDRLFGDTGGEVQIGSGDLLLHEAHRALTLGITGPVAEGGVRALEDDAVLHESVIWMMAADSSPTYKPANVRELISRLERKKEEAAKFLSWLHSSGHISLEDLQRRKAHLEERTRIQVVS